MTINEYQKAALRTESDSTACFANNFSILKSFYTGYVSHPRLLQGLMGLNGEAGECIDIMKKTLFQGHEFDKEHMAKELGDVAWYLALCADAIGYDLETVLQMNIDKLKARYPDGFNVDHSVHRNINDI